MEKSTLQLQSLPSPADLGDVIRQRVVEAIQIVLEEELTAALGSARYERSESRRGYRNGSEPREVTTELGPVALQVPRGRIERPDGSTAEFRSTVLPKYQRRTRKVDETILGTYLSGSNTRRVRKALEPLLGEANLSKSAISRVVKRLRELFTRWTDRDLSEESYPIVYLDGVHLKVRLVRRVVSVPVLVALGVDEEGRKRLISLRLLGKESGATWEELVGDLKKRHLPEPSLVIADGHKGLTRAKALWKDAKRQRCVVHKLANLLTYCPSHARAELRRDYHRITYAKDGSVAREEYGKFVKKWRSLSEAVVKSLEEAGLELLTFYEFPRPLWKAIRSTNAIENLNREFRRRTKTQGSFSGESSALTLLWGLVAFEQIRLRKIDGHAEVRKLVEDAAGEEQAA